VRPLAEKSLLLRLDGVCVEIDQSRMSEHGDADDPTGSDETNDVSVPSDQQQQQQQQQGSAGSEDDEERDDEQNDEDGEQEEGEEEEKVEKKVTIAIVVTSKLIGD